MPADFPILFYLDNPEHEGKSRPGPHHFHDLLEIAYCHQGEGLLMAGSKVMPYAADDTIVIGPGEPHYAQSRPGVACVLTWCFFDPLRLLGEEARDMTLCDIRSLQGPSFRNVLPQRECPHIAAVMRLLVHEARARRPFDRDAIAACARLLLAQFRRLPGQSSDGGVDAGELQRLAPALELVRSRYQDRLTVTQLAQACFMSGSGFRQHFRLCMGTSPHDYLQRYRISMAKIELLHGERTLQAIAARTGFPTMSSFLRAFKKTIGTSPRRWARQARQAQP